VGASDKKYNLAVALCVTFPIGYDYNIELLREQIYIVDEMNPWIAYYESGARAKSINWMSTPEMREGGGVDRLYLVEVRPQMCGTFAQAGAYEKYGESLARNLVRLLPSSVLSVQSRLILNGTYGERHEHPLRQ
jgi:hypothetical protein